MSFRICRSQRRVEALLSGIGEAQSKTNPDVTYVGVQILNIVPLGKPRGNIGTRSARPNAWQSHAVLDYIGSSARKYKSSLCFAFVFLSLYVANKKVLMLFAQVNESGVRKKQEYRSCKP